MLFADAAAKRIVLIAPFALDVALDLFKTLTRTIITTQENSAGVLMRMAEEAENADSGDVPEPAITGPAAEPRTGSTDGGDASGALRDTPRDPATGNPLAARDGEFLGYHPRAMDWFRNGEAPLGMTPETYQAWKKSLRDALEADGIPPDSVDVRLLGSGGRGFSGPHKLMPSDDQIRASYPPDVAATAIQRKADWLGDDPDRLGGRPFDAMYKLGLDPYRSDYDTNISSDAMVAKARAHWDATGQPGSFLNGDHEYVNKDIARETFPAVNEWANTWSDELHLNREVSRAVFPGSRPRMSPRRPGTTSTSGTVTGSSSDQEAPDMPMTRALTVRLTGPMPEGTLRQVREDLSLRSRGRLSDVEDAHFGYRYLQKDDQNWVSLDLSRQDDTNWAFYLTYLSDPPSPETISQVLADITAAAARHGFTVAEVIRLAADGGAGSAEPDRVAPRPPAAAADDRHPDVAAADEHLQGQDSAGKANPSHYTLAGDPAGDQDPAGRRAANRDIVIIDSDCMDLGSGTGIVVTRLQSGEQLARLEGLGTHLDPRRPAGRILRLEMRVVGRVGTQPVPNILSPYASAP